MPDLPIIVRPGLNEELAATAVMGSQLADSLDDKRYDGVVGVWYGKAPGLDRAGDAIRHGVFAGTARHGGVMAIVGDDPAAKSSTLPSSSDATLVDLHMPILFPGDVQEALDLSRHAVALSRASGIWVGLKLVTPVADGTGTVDVHPDRVQPVTPTMEFDGKLFVPHPSGRLLTPYTLEMEREFQQVRSELARRYGVANHLNRVTVSTERDWLGIAASGHTYHELREALGLLGLAGDDDLRNAGIRLFQLLMPVPVDEQQIRDFAHGLAEVLVIEEKNPTLELLVKSAMYDSDERPRVVGRHDETGGLLIPGTGMLDADRLLEPLRRRLVTRLGDDAVRPLPAKQAASRIPLTINRTPFYCSGCPHNLSTRVPEGTLVGGGIGCHAMIALMEPERVGDIAGLTAMGNEGAQWIGMAPFVERGHLVQNLGDGTYFHSGSLAIRAAVASGVDITYKLLYNGTVAMTGGQDPQGQMTVPEVVQSLLLEGVSRIIVTSDDPGKWDDADFGSRADGRVEVRDRTRLMESQVELADVPGVTVLVHDQRCAAELRRDRSRGVVAKPGFRVVINERVCEGCGDCGDKSNCLSVQPVETAFGRKTRIHQTSCNFDMSCLQGDCPSFATVTVDADGREAGEAPRRRDGRPGGRAARSRRRGARRRVHGPLLGHRRDRRHHGQPGARHGGDARRLHRPRPRPDRAVPEGGTRRQRPAPQPRRRPGVEPRQQLRRRLPHGVRPARRGERHPPHRRRRGRARSSSAPSPSTPTGAMVAHPTTPYPDLGALTGRLDEVSRPGHNRFVDAAALATGLFGDSTTANILLLGVAVQAGAIAVSPPAIERAIELNGVAVARNVAAFRWGRRWAAFPADVEQAAGIATAPAPETTDELIDRLAAELVAYQDDRYARRFLDLVGVARQAELRVDPASTAFTAAVARFGFKLMAYKDEYEVARLLLAPEARAAYEAVGGPGTKVTWRLHPPMLRAAGMKQKMKLGPRTKPVLATLARSKRVRGTLADPFRWAEVRKLERAMIPEYERAVARLAESLRATNLADAVEIASLPDQVRGYEHLKLARATAYRAELAERLASFR